MIYEFSAQQLSEYLKPELTISKGEIFRFAKILRFKFPLNLNQAIKIRKLKMKQKNLTTDNKIIYIRGFRQCPDKAKIILQMLPLDEIKYDKILIIDSSSYMHLSSKTFNKFKIDDWEVEKIEKINSRVDFLCDRFFYLNENDIFKKLKKYHEFYNKIIICIDEETNIPFLSKDIFMVYNPENISSHLRRRHLNYEPRAKTLEISENSNEIFRSIESNAQHGIYKTKLTIRKELSLNFSLLEQKSLGSKTLSMIKDFFYHTDKDMFNTMLNTLLKSK